MTNIFVGNLPYQTTEAELETAFAEFGAVERVSIVRDRTRDRRGALRSWRWPMARRRPMPSIH